ncbi:Holliday junction ATP-dependent DNA helicase RuvB [Bacilli bacterium]|nr:Holliday junction ATP-dependent DNA helicase RuvB [Bacilli bacterium]
MLKSLRVTKLADFKGKPEIRNNLAVYIKSCAKQNKPLDHCLFYGLPGTGKTSLAHIIANELNHKIRVIQGNGIQRNIDIVNLAMTLTEFDILFIDEIHGINQQCVELLYSIMEDFVIDIALGKDFNSKITRIHVPHFTLIGATTKLGKIDQPLIDRFGIIINLKTYDEASILEILKQSMVQLELNLTDEELLLLAKNSKGIPRNANRLISRVKDFRIFNPQTSIKRILKHLEIVEQGMNIDDLTYLRALHNLKRPVGLRTIAQMINIDENTIETKIEPFLIFNQFIEKTASGRGLTNNGNKFVNKHATQYKE